MIPLHPVSSHSKSKAWYNQPAEETLARLGSSAAGLTAEEAARRLLKCYSKFGGKDK
jgi:hypothetical protein